MTQTRKRATSNKRFGHKKNSGNLRLSVKKGPIQKKTMKSNINNSKKKVGGFQFNLGEQQVLLEANLGENSKYMSLMTKIPLLNLGERII